MTLDSLSVIIINAEYENDYHIQNTSERSDKMASRKNRFISWIILLIFSFVILGSAFFIIFNEDHLCCGNECSVCTELEKCHSVLQTCGNASVENLCCLSILYSVISLIKTVIRTHSEHNTLVSLKVELLN